MAAYCIHRLVRVQASQFQGIIHPNNRRLTRLVGWEINVPFQHKNRLHRGQSLGRRFSSARL